MKYFSLLLLICFAEVSWGYSDFYQQRQKGWFWFKEQKQEESEKENPDTFNPKSVAEFREAIENAKEKMIMNPTIANTKRYVELQNLLFKRAEQVKQSWQQVLLINPEVDLTRKTPISQTGANIARELEINENNEAIKQFAGRFRLLFFYRHDCPFCKAFIPVLNNFIHKYGFQIASVSMDGKSYKEFPAQSNLELVQKFKVQFTPAVFAYSEAGGIAIPLGTGFMSLSALEKHVLIAIKALQ